MSRAITVIGDGGWGTALAVILRQKGFAVRVWGPFEATLARIRAAGVNEDFLPGVALPAGLEWTNDRAAAVRGAEAVVLAVPTQYFRRVVSSFAGLIPAGVPVVSVAKGLDADTHERMTQVAEQALGQGAVAALSGPSFAEEVARGAPTAVVVACADAGRARALQDLLSTPRFRIYTSDDVVGVELGGALKNVIALAVGVSDGIGFGHNTRAALVTRGLVEITRLGCAMGAHPATFAGLSGLGDLVLTCTSRLSRNHTVGERLGRGEKITDILAGMKQVAEGVTNCRHALAVAREHGVAVPITEEVHAVVWEGQNPQKAVESLLGRDPRPERDC
jgi:glycerol-3-phosphate dehydrogenase (NAD(P)+)